MNEALAMPKRASMRGLILLAVVVLAWGTLWPVNKALLAYMTPIWSIALRTCISALTLFAISWCVTGIAAPKRQDAPVLVSMVVLHMVGFTVLSQLALRVVPAGQSTVLAYTSVLWVPLGAALFLGERLTLRRAIGLGLGVLGLIAIFNPAAFDWSDRGAVAGNAALLVAAALWASSIVHNRSHNWRSTPFQLAPWPALLATAILVPIAFVFEGLPNVTWNATSLAMLLYAGIPGTALAYWAVAMASRFLPAITTSLGLLATPVVSIVVAAVWLQELPTADVLAAMGLILGGIAIGTPRSDALPATPISGR